MPRKVWPGDLSDLQFETTNWCYSESVATLGKEERVHLPNCVRFSDGMADGMADGMNCWQCLVSTVTIKSRVRMHSILWGEIRHTERRVEDAL